MKRALEAATGGPACPCCIERVAFTNVFKPTKRNAASADLCSICTDIDGWSDSLPPFQWPTTVAEIEAGTDKVLQEAEANLAAVAGASPPTFQTVIKPLMLAKNYKTNHLVCQSKFLQHGSPDAALREVSHAASLPPLPVANLVFGPSRG